MSLWLVNATKFNFTGEGGEGQRGHVDLRASPQVKMEIAQRGARTHDPEIKSLMLYRLS